MMSNPDKEKGNEKQSNAKPMFCKKCGAKIPAGGKFCPTCGTPVQIPEQKTERRAAGIAGDRKEENRKASNTAGQKNGRKKDPRIGQIVAASVLMVLIVGIAIFVKRPGGKEDKLPDKKQSDAAYTAEEVAEMDVPDASDTDSEEESDFESEDVPDESDAGDDYDDFRDGPGFHKENYEDMPFSKDQIKELESIYNTAYEDEKAGLDSYIVEYAKNYNPYGDMIESFDQLSGVTEDFYQAVNEFDPNLKDVIAADAGDRLGNGILGNYLVTNGVSAILADDEAGRAIRSGIAEVAITGLEALAIWGMENDRENAVRSDAMVPLASSGDYALVRSNGTIWAILEEMKLNNGYSIAKMALEERRAQIESWNTSDLEDYWTEDEEELFETYKLAENLDGRRDAQEEKRQEWVSSLYQWNYEFLTMTGIEDVDALLQSGVVDNSRWEGSWDYPEDEDSEDENSEEEVSEAEDYEDEDYEDEYFEYFPEDDLEAFAQELSQYVYSIMDKEGKIYTSFLLPTGQVNALINDEGTCSVWQGSVYYSRDFASDNSSPHIMVDRNGNVLYESYADCEEKYIYLPITQSGNLLKKTFKSDFDHGDYEILELVYPDGKSEKLMEGGYIDIIPEEGCSDYFTYSCGYDDGSSQTNGVIDASDGSLLTDSEYEEMKAEQKLQGQEVEMQIPGVEGTVMGSRLNEKYVLYENTIYNESGEAIKELTEGRGVLDIWYADGRYWVVTASGWYYILDDEFNEILEPVEMVSTQYRMTDAGILADEPTDVSDTEEEKHYTCLYDENGNSNKLFEQRGNYQIEGFIIHEESMNGSELMGGINIYTKEPVLMSIPEIPVHIGFPDV